MASKALPLSDLIKAVDKTPVRRTLTYKGQEYEYYSTFLTLGQRERVRNSQKNLEDANEFALKLLIKKALKKDGSRMFQDGQYAELKEDWPSQEIEEAMLKLIQKQPEEDLDPDEELVQGKV